MIISYTDRNKLEEFMKNNLKEKRYIHSLGVEKMAAKLAKIYGADIEKAAFAGRYHDIAKCFDVETINAYIIKYNISKKYIDDTALAHSKVAAEILKNEFSVVDEDILNAVRSHTTGRAGMSLLEEIVYVSDAIEENRNYPELKDLQDLALVDLDSACLSIMNFAILMIKEKNRIVDDETISARKYIIKKRSKDGK